MKVVHHGSKYSSNLKFLELVSPKIAVISAGKDNRYGHPHPEAVDRLKEVGCEIYVTKDTGAVIVR